MQDGVRVHVAGALPDESVDATIAHVSPHRPDAGASLGDVASTLRDLLAEHAVPGYDERTHEGLLRYAILRVNHLGQVLVTLVTGDAAFADGEAIARALVAARPAVVGVVQNINRSRGN